MHLPENLDHILPLVRKPGRYIGGELHACVKDWDGADVRFSLVFPDLYEIGMSHFGLQILYHILNAREHTLADRCFCPDIDMEQVLRQHDIPLFSLESRRSLADFDAIGITLPYELCYTNILTILDLAGIPLRSEDRDQGSPLIIGGGSCGLNPEPVADFFDVIVLGDGEEVIVDIAEAIRRTKKAGMDRAEVLAELAEIEGVYVPSFFAPHYSGGELVTVQSLKPGYESVRRRVLPKLPGPEGRGKPLVPIVRPVHDRLGIEIARGCTRGCRFCQAGMIYRPARERSIDEIMTIAEQDIGSTGYEELALLSLSSGDYSCLTELMIRLMDRFADQYVSVSMPSMRVGTLTPEIMDQIKRVRKTGFTVAPEAGTDRLREVINKGISEADLLETCRNAFAMGWNLIKFYFMIGLPTETWEDVEAIVDLARKARNEAGPSARRVQINVSVGTFVPKPHTPFQWEPQLTLAQSRERINRLKSLLPRKGFKLKWHDPNQSYLEGVFSRGDRRLSSLIETAWKSGVRLDGWSEHYRLENWLQAAESCGIDLDLYLQARDLEKPLPWDHLDCGVDKDFLKQEHANALERVYTPDCRTQGCQKCGLCDFKTLFPVVHSAKKITTKVTDIPPGNESGAGEHDRVFFSRVYYTRLEDSRFFSHLEILQLIFRALTRAGVPVLYSQGYNPSPRVSFSPALPVGMESEAEFFDMALPQPLSNPEEVLASLNREFPAGMRVTKIGVKPDKEPDALLVDYTVTLVNVLTDEQQENIARFLVRESYVIERVRKNKRRELDIRPLVASLETEGTTMNMSLVSIQGQAGVSPRNILKEVAFLSDEDVLLARIKKNTVTIFSANA
jgi:radical SAM family uncharacterized protein/radical SAM-linked protein